MSISLGGSLSERENFLVGVCVVVFLSLSSSSASFFFFFLREDNQILMLLLSVLADGKRLPHEVTAVWMNL